MKLKRMLAIVLGIAVVGAMYSGTSVKASSNPSLTIVTSPNYDSSIYFSEGLAVVHNADGYSYIDTNGKVKIGPIKEKVFRVNTGRGIVSKKDKVRDVTNFHEGLAFLNQYKGVSESQIVIDTNGKEIVQSEDVVGDSQMGSYMDGISVAEMVGETAGPVTLVDKNRKATKLDMDKITGNNFNHVDSICADGLLAYLSQKESKVGYVDVKMKEIAIRPQFEDVRQFYNGIAPAKLNGKWGFINTKGNFIIKPQYEDFFANDSNYSCKVFDNDIASVKKNGKWGVINKNGQVVVDFKYDSNISFLNGMAVIDKSGKYGYIDTKGNEVIKPQYDDANYFSNNVALVGNDGTYYLIDKSGKKVSSQTWQFEGSFVSDNTPDMISYKQNEEWGLAKINATVTNPVIVTGVALNTASLSIVKGNTAALIATIAPSTAANKGVTWKSSNSSVATVNSNGKITAVGAGTATITCTTADGSNKSATCTVTVTNPVTVTGITLNSKNLSLVKGSAGSLTATVAPSNATNKGVTWKSSNTSVATVDSNGKVTAVGAGSAAITCTTADWSNKSAICTVTVTNPVSVTAITLNKTLSVVKGNAGTLTATVAPSTATNKNITWKSSNTAVATVDSTGRVTGVAAGTATITCTANDGSGKSATCKVTVTNPVAVTGITLNSKNLSLVKRSVGSLIATVAPSNATNKNVIWKSSNTSIATVDSTGKVTGVAAGTATITCSASDGSGKTSTCAVTVTSPITVTAITLNKTLSVVKGNAGTLTATVAPSTATNKNITWKSSNTAVATVDSTGKVTGVAAGTATITCTANDGSGKSATCTVTVTNPAAVTGITLNSKTLSVVKGNTGNLTATIAPSNATNKVVTWKSSNAAVAKVDSAGKVTGIAAGSATITCTASDGSGKRATCAVTVTNPITVTGITLNKTTLSLLKGNTGNLTATIAPSNATNKVVTWKSSNTAVATVDSTGKITGVAAGSATITCTAIDGSGKSATCVVTVTNPITATGITLNSKTLSLVKGNTRVLTAAIVPSDATNRAVTWKSSNTAVATVDSTGKVTGVGVGTATITCTASDGSGKSVTCAVTVTK